MVTGITITPTGTTIPTTTTVAIAIQEEEVVPEDEEHQEQIIIVGLMALVAIRAINVKIRLMATNTMLHSEIRWVETLMEVLINGVRQR